MTVEPQAPRTANARFIAGDALRGLVCLVIVAWHFTVAAAGVVGNGRISPGLHHEIGVAGKPVIALAMSVWFFFMLSGYLISGPFVRAVVRGDGRRPRIGAYTRNRVLRIVPAFWFFLILTLLITGTLGNSHKQTLLFFFFGHVYDQGPFTERMVQAWTLDVEVVFYALVPLVLLPLAALLRGRGTPWSRAAVILVPLAAITVASLAVGAQGPGSGARVIPGSAWAFAPGVALATIEPLVRDRLAGREAGRWLARALLALGAGAFLVYAYSVESVRDRNIASCIAVSCLLAAPLVLQWTTGRSWRALDNRFLNWYGVRAYGIYLIHVILIFEVRHLIDDTGSTAMALLLVLPLVLVISTIVGYLSFRFVESPFLERRLPWRRAEPPRPARVEPAPAP